MIYVTCGLNGNMEWPKWADNFITAYLVWSEAGEEDDIEFCNMGTFIAERNIALAEFKEVITATYTREGLKSTETHFVFGWSEMAEQARFVLAFENFSKDAPP